MCARTYVKTYHVWVYLSQNPIINSILNAIIDFEIQSVRTITVVRKQKGSRMATNSFQFSRFVVIDAILRAAKHAQ